jgi:hypothetical protein
VHSLDRLPHWTVHRPSLWTTTWPPCQTTCPS